MPTNEKQIEVWKKELVRLDKEISGYERAVSAAERRGDEGAVAALSADIVVAENRRAQLERLITDLQRKKK